MKVKLIALALFILMLTAFTGCTAGEKTEIIFGESLVSCDVILCDRDGYGVSVPYAYKCKNGITEFEVLEIEGENIDSADISITNSEIAEGFEATYKGYEIGFIGVMVQLKGSVTVKIDSLRLKINGQEEKLTFEKPLSYTPDTYEGKAVSWGQGPVMIGSADDKLDVTFGYDFQEKCEITGIELKGNYELGEIYYARLNGETVSQPFFKVDGGDKVGYDLSLVKKDSDIVSNVCNFIINYKTEDGDTDRYILTFAAMPISDYQIPLEKVVDGKQVEK